MRLALYQPDIPQNAGTMMRMAACLGIAVDLIEPAGFDISDRNLRRAGLDYLEHLELRRHPSFGEFDRWRRENGFRLVLATTRGAMPYTSLLFRDRDILMVGRESAGVPERDQANVDLSIRVPIRPGLRSLNVAVAAAMITGEALRQLRPPGPESQGGETSA